MGQTNENHAWLDQELDSRLPAGWSPDTDGALSRLRERRAHRKRNALAGGVAIACTGAALLASPTARAMAERCLDACVSQSARAGNFVLTGLAPKGTRRQAAPALSLTASDGTTIRLADFRGKVVLLNFWATWCPPCREEIPWFIEFQRTHSARGFSVIGVAMDEEGWKNVLPFARQQDINYPLAIGDASAAASFGVSSLPATLVIDRQGRIAAVHSGLADKEAYRASIEAAIAEP